MSKYPWYVEFEEDGDKLRVASVSYAESNEEHVIKITDENKNYYFGTFEENPELQYFTYSLEEIDDKVEVVVEPYLELDLTEQFTGFPIEGYTKRLREDLFLVVHILLEMHDQIGDIWKMPDAYDCLLYAQEEAGEYLSDVILQVRTSDSRNNRTTEVTDVAMEMFDTSMMVIRSIISDLMEKGLNRNEILLVIDKWSYEWAENRRKNPYKFEELLNHLFLQEPASLSLMIGATLSHYYSYMSGGKGIESDKDAAYKDYLMMAFSTIEYIMFHPVVQSQVYIQLADKKLKKIYDKSLAKKEQLQNVTA